MLPPLPLAGDVTVSKVSTLTLQSPRHQLLLATVLVARCCVCVCVCVALERRQQRDRVGASTLSPENQTHGEVRSARALERAVYVTHVEMRPVITL